MPVHTYTRWDAIPAGVWPGRHITPREFAERSSGHADGSSPIMWDDAFIAKLDRLRVAIGVPVVITSGYRSPKYNARVSKTGEGGPHTTGRACDISIGGRHAWLILKYAATIGFTGIGVQQKGASRFIHLDDLEAPAYPRPTVWSY